MKPKIGVKMPCENCKTRWPGKIIRVDKKGNCSECGREINYGPGPIIPNPPRPVVVEPVLWVAGAVATIVMGLVADKIGMQPSEVGGMINTAIALFPEHDPTVIGIILSAMRDLAVDAMESYSATQRDSEHQKPA